MKARVPIWVMGDVMQRRAMAGPLDRGGPGIPRTNRCGSSCVAPASSDFQELV